MQPRLVTFVEKQIFGPPEAQFTGEEQPAMEPLHDSEKNGIRSVDTDHRAWVWQIFDPGVQWLIFPEMRLE